MDSAVVVAIITALAAVVTTYMSVRSANEKILAEMRSHAAVQDEKIDTLTREVRRHNDFATRIPVMEEKIKTIEKEVRDD